MRKHGGVDLATHGADLAAAVTEALPGWVERCVEVYAVGLDTTAAGAAAAADIGPRLALLLAADIDEQRVNPLALVREAVRYPTEVLRAAGVRPPPRRPGFDAEHFPDDVYGFVPMTWRDVDESLHEPGIVWGALKARAHQERHRS
jgi:hypothetical protein